MIPSPITDKSEIIINPDREYKDYYTKIGHYIFKVYVLGKKGQTREGASISVTSNDNFYPNYGTNSKDEDGNWYASFNYSPVSVGLHTITVKSGELTKSIQLDIKEWSSQDIKIEPVSLRNTYIAENIEKWPIVYMPSVFIGSFKLRIYPYTSIRFQDCRLFLDATYPIFYFENTSKDKCFDLTLYPTDKDGFTEKINLYVRDITTDKDKLTFYLRDIKIFNAGNNVSYDVPNLGSFELEIIKK